MKAEPTLPLTKLTPPSSTPLLAPSTSEASPSAAHQLTSPADGGAHTGTYTVSTAFVLMAEPTLLETKTEYVPASVSCTLVQANALVVAPFRLVPLSSHW